MLQINLLQDKVIEEVAQSQIGWLISLDQIETQRLKKQPAVNDITRPDIIAVSLNEIGPHRTERHFHRHRLLVAPDVKLHGVAFEFSLDNFGHLDAVTFEFHIPVAGDWMIVDCQEHVPFAQDVGTRARGHDCRDEHAAIFIF